MKASAVHPHGPDPESRGPLDIGDERVPDADHVLRPDAERLKGRLEDPGTRLVRLSGFRRDGGVEAQAISLEDVSEELVGRVGDHSARDTIAGLEDLQTLGARFALS